MGLNKIPQFLLIILLSLFWAGICQAGFGVSPPWVKCEHLLQGSHFEQTISLVQSDTKTDFYATVELSSELSGIKDWIKIDKGMEFTIPGGVQQFPIKITVDVPQNAKLGEYGGYIWINGKPTKEAGTQITTMTGGTIEVALKVTDEEFSDWTLRGLGVRNLAKDEKTIKAYLRVENLGNVKARPSKVHLDVYDDNHQNLLSSGDDTELDWIPPFQTQEIIAEFPVDLEPTQQYWAEIEIYKEDELLLADKRRFNVGEIPTKEVPGQVSKPLEELEESETGLKFGFLKNKIFLFSLLGIVLAVGLGFGIRRIRKSGIGLEIKIKKKTAKRKKVKGEDD